MSSLEWWDWEPLQFESVHLIEDLNGNGVVDGEEGNSVRATARVAINGDTGSLLFDFNDQALVGGGQLYRQGDFRGLRTKDAFRVTLTTAGLRSVEVNAVVSGSTSVVFHEADEALFVVDAGFQVSNQLVESSLLSDTPLLGFTFIPGGRTIQGLTFEIEDVFGIHDFEVTNLRLIRDANLNGQLDPGETSAFGGAGAIEIDEDLRAGTIEFSAPFQVIGSYLLVADIANVESDDYLTVSLRSENIVVGLNDVVDGGVSPVRHSVTRPELPNSSYQQNWTLTWRSPGGVTVTGGYSRDGTKAVLGYSSGAAYVYDLESRAPKKLFMRHFDSVQYASFSEDDSQIITVTKDGAVYIWNAESGALERSLFADVLVDYAVPSPSFDRLFVVSGGQSRATMLDVLTGERLWEFDVGAQLNSIDFSPDGSRLVVGTSKIDGAAAQARDKIAYLVDARTGAIPTTRINGNTYEMRYVGHSGPVTGVAFAANGTRIITSSDDATAVLWDVNNPLNPLVTISLNGERSKYVWVNHDGTRIGMITGVRTARMFNEIGLQLYNLELPEEGFSGKASFATFTDDGSEFMVGSDDLSHSGALVSRFVTESKTYLGVVGPKGKVSTRRESAVKMSEDGRRIFFMKNNGLEVMHREIGVPIRHYPDLNSSNNYDVTPDGSKLAWLQGRDLNYAIVDQSRLTVIASNQVARSNSPLTLSDSGGLALLDDRLYFAATGDLFADSPNPDGTYYGAFSPSEEFWGIAIGDTIKTMRTTDAAGGLEFAATDSACPNIVKPPIYHHHPDGLRVACVSDRDVRFYRIDTAMRLGFTMIADLACSTRCFLTMAPCCWCRAATASASTT